MSGHVAVLGLVVLLASAPASAADDALAVLPHWKAGEKLHYEKIKTREQTADGRPVQTMVARSALEVEVISTGDDGSVLAWTAGEARFDDPAQAANPLVQRLGNLLKNARAVLELDRHARITGVRNWKELQEKSFAMRDALVAEVRAEGADQALVDQIGAQVTAMIDTRPKIEDLVGRGEAQLFLLPLGVALSASQPLEIDGALPNMLGGEPIPARVRFELKAFDRASRHATIAYTQTVKPEEFRRIMERSAREMAARTGRPGPDPQQLAGMMLEDRAEYVVDVGSGWVQRFTHDRTVQAGAGRQRDTVTIRRVPAP